MLGKSDDHYSYSPFEETTTANTLGILEYTLSFNKRTQDPLPRPAEFQW